MNFEFGVSFNCYVGRDVVGGADIACDISTVSNDREKLIAHTLNDNGLEFIYTTDHEYVGGSTNVGGDVVGVFLDKDDTEFIVAVLLTNPMVPDVV